MKSVKYWDDEWLAIAVVSALMLLCASFVAADVIHKPIVAVSGEPVVMPFTSGANCSFPLIAAQNIEVGEVLLTWTDTHLWVTYLITDYDWTITEANFGWQETPFPYAIPGKLQRVFDHLTTQALQFKIPRTEVHSDLYFAAHAVVKSTTPCSAGTKHLTPNQRNNPHLPSYTSFRAYQGGSRAMFRLELEGAPPFNRNGFNGWCLDRQRKVRTGQTYDARVITDWDELAGIVDHPENIHYVEWIMEQNFVGREIVCGKIVTRRHVQLAIWNLLDDPKKPMTCVPRALVRRALSHKGPHQKSTTRNCWGTQAIFVLDPLYKTYMDDSGQQIVSPNHKVQPMIVDLRGIIECPSPTPTQTPTEKPSPSPTPTPSNTPTATPTPTGTWTPPPTPTYTPTATPTPTCKPSKTPTPTPCVTVSSETAWAQGQYWFNQKWGWSFRCSDE